MVNISQSPTAVFGGIAVNKSPLVYVQVFQKFISPLIFGLEKCYIQFWKANSEYFSVVNNSPSPTAVFGGNAVNKSPLV